MTGSKGSGRGALVPGRGRLVRVWLLRAQEMKAASLLPTPVSPYPALLARSATWRVLKTRRLAFDSAQS